jgi:predicted site-specific integrase-resolvase
LKFLGIGEAAKALGVSEQTLRNWEKRGWFVPHHKSAAGTRYYTQEQINAFLGVIGREVKDNRKIIAYCRVSSYKQKDDLERQIDNVRMYCISRGYQFEIITDIGSGINYNKKGINKLLNMVINGEVSKIIVLYKDRLLRFGYELFENICKAYGTEIEIIDSTEKTEEQELVEDLVQIITVFSCKLHGKRPKNTKKLLEQVARRIE